MPTEGYRLLVGDLETHLSLVTDVGVERLVIQSGRSVTVQVDTRTVALDKLIAWLRPSRQGNGQRRPCLGGRGGNAQAGRIGQLRLCRQVTDRAGSVIGEREHQHFPPVLSPDLSPNLGSRRCSARRAETGSRSKTCSPAQPGPAKTDADGFTALNGCLRAPGVLHPPFREAVGTELIGKSDHPQVAERLPCSTVDRRALDHDRIRGSRNRTPGEGRVAWLILVGKPLIDDLLATPPWRGVRLSAVLRILGEQGGDVIGMVGIPCPHVAVDPGADAVVVGHGPIMAESWPAGQ